MLIEHFELVDAILTEFEESIGDDLLPYKNHVYRMLNFVNAIGKLSETELLKAQIAAAFHDIGIWTAGTVDYIDPSVAAAKTWLEKSGEEMAELSAQEKQEILDMIEWHHKISAIEDNPSPLPELFRQGDLVDFSLGLVRFGVSDSFVKAVKHRFPNAGFHKMLLRLSFKRLLSHPLDPAPMMRR